MLFLRSDYLWKKWSNTMKSFTYNQKKFTFLQIHAYSNDFWASRPYTYSCLRRLCCYEALSPVNSVGVHRFRVHRSGLPFFLWPCELAPGPTAMPQYPQIDLFSCLLRYGLWVEPLNLRTRERLRNSLYGHIYCLMLQLSQVNYI